MHKGIEGTKQGDFIRIYQAGNGRDVRSTSACKGRVIWPVSS